MRPSLDPKLDPSHPHYNPDPHAHPGLHIIALIEAIKVLLDHGADVNAQDTRLNQPLPFIPPLRGLLRAKGLVRP